MRLMVGGKYVGDLEGVTLTKRGKQVVKFHVFDGFGMSRELLKNPKIKLIHLYYQQRLYKTTVAKYLRHGIPYHKPPYEPQLVLPTRYFEIVDDRQTRIL